MLDKGRRVTLCTRGWVLADGISTVPVTRSNSPPAAAVTRSRWKRFLCRVNPPWLFVEMQQNSHGNAFSVVLFLCVLSSDKVRKVYPQVSHSIVPPTPRSTACAPLAHSSIELGAYDL